jgi:hypothetical protein
MYISSNLPTGSHPVWGALTCTINNTTFIPQEIRVYNTKLNVFTLWSRWWNNLISVESTWIIVTHRGKILYCHKNRRFITLFKKSRHCTSPQDTRILLIFNPIFSNMFPPFTHKYTFSPLYFVMMLTVSQLYFHIQWLQIKWTQFVARMLATGNTHLNEGRLGNCVANKYLEFNVNTSLGTSNFKKSFFLNPRKFFEIQRTISETLNILRILSYIFKEWKYVACK